MYGNQGGSGGRMAREVGTDIYTLGIRQITAGKRLCRTETSAQGSVVTSMGRKSQTEGRRVRTADSAVQRRPIQRLKATVSQ